MKYIFLDDERNPEDVFWEKYDHGEFIRNIVVHIKHKICNVIVNNKLWKINSLPIFN